MNLSLIVASATAALVLLLPGWALLAASGAWRIFRPLQRWIVAFGISAAFFPVFYYFLNSAMSGFRLGVNKLWILLALCLLVSLLFLRRHLLEQFRFDALEWAGIAIFATTLFSRLYLIREYPYPAWSDSLAHSLLTLLTAQQGGLPADLSPYAPTPLGMYHLGLYSLTAPVMLLAKVEATTALLVVVQILNGLCGAGVYLLLDRSGHRLGALTGAAVAGLFSFQPAWYFNWGRDTQLASQAVLLIALVLTWLAVDDSTGGQGGSPWIRRSLVLAASLANASVFLLHFRVAAFYLPLLAVALAWVLKAAYAQKTFGPTLKRIVWVGLGSLVLCLPALIAALPAYLESRSAAGSPDPSYYEVTPEAIYAVGLHKWLAASTAAALLLGISLKNKISWWSGLWTTAVVAIGLAYLTGIRVLMVTNIGAVLIMLYLPASLAIGAAVSSLVDRIKPLSARQIVYTAAAGLVIAGIFGARDRMHGFEPYRFFVKPADVQAMNWIQANTPTDAVFAINTWFWLSYAPHGTDAGFWIPYYTGRRTTASTMLFSLGPPAAAEEVIQKSHAAEKLAESPPQVADLCQLGVRYAYAGSMGDFSGTPINTAELASVEGVDLLYQADGVSIFSLCGN